MHCPFCGDPASAGCPHFLAQRTRDEHWVFSGLSLQTGIPGDDAAASQVWHLLRPTPEELTDCFGDLAPLCAWFYEPDADPQAILAALFIEKFHWSNCQAVRFDGRGWRYIAFAEDAAEQRTVVKETMDRIRAGFRRWKERYVARGIQNARFLPRPTSNFAPTNVAFDPTGGYLLAHQGNRFLLWEFDSAREPSVLHLETGEGYKNYGWARYTDLRFRMAPAESAYYLRYTARTPQSRDTTEDLPSDDVHHLEVRYRLGSAGAQPEQISPPDSALGEWMPLMPRSIAPRALPGQNCRVTVQDAGYTLELKYPASDGEPNVERYRFRSPITECKSGANRSFALVISGRTIIWQTE